MTTNVRQGGWLNVHGMEDGWHLRRCRVPRRRTRPVQALLGTSLGRSRKAGHRRRGRSSPRPPRGRSRTSTRRCCAGCAGRTRLPGARVALLGAARHREVADPVARLGDALDLQPGVAALRRGLDVHAQEGVVEVPRVSSSTRAMSRGPRPRPVRCPGASCVRARRREQPSAGCMDKPAYAWSGNLMWGGSYDIDPHEETGTATVQWSGV